MSSQPKTLLTPEEYLAVERKAASKSEYFQGEMFAMAGAGERHNLVSLNLAAALHSQLRGRSCRAYVADLPITAVAHFVKLAAALFGARASVGVRSIAS